MDDDYIDTNKFAKRLATKEQSIAVDSDLSDRNKEIILGYIRDSKIGKAIRKGQKRKISDGRNLQTATYLTRMAKDWFKKDLDKVTEKDVVDFILKLESGEIKSRYKTPMKSETQCNIKKFIRKFYKHLYGNGKTVPEMVEWIDTSKKIANIKAIPNLKEGVDKIISLIPSIRKKALISVAFDSGFRSDELLNVRIKDLERRSDGIYYITCRYSKTKPRTVSIPLASKHLNDWMIEHPEKNNSDAQAFLVSKIMFTKTINLYGKKALKTHITPHMLRHTSATYYASRLDRTSFCKRYGWSYSSNSPDRYIDFIKIEENKVIDIIKKEQKNTQRAEVEQLKIENKKLMKKMKELDQYSQKMKMMETIIMQKFADEYKEAKQEG